MMYNLMTPYYRRKRFLRRKRQFSIWNLMRRYQLVELVGLTGAIAVVWLGVHLDNQHVHVQTPEPDGIESASADLITGVPVGRHRRF